MEDGSCIFCRIIKGEIPGDKVYEDDNFMAIKDINPKLKGHTIIFPKKHFKTFLDVPNSLGNEMIEAVKKTTLKLMDEEKAEGFNIHVNGFEAGGQLGNHVHLHIFPRKKDDGFKTCV